MRRPGRIWQGEFDTPPRADLTIFETELQGPLGFLTFPNRADATTTRARGEVVEGPVLPSRGWTLRALLARR